MVADPFLLWPERTASCVAVLRAASKRLAWPVRCQALPEYTAKNTLLDGGRSAVPPYASLAQRHCRVIIYAAGLVTRHTSSALWMRILSVTQCHPTE